MTTVSGHSVGDLHLTSTDFNIGPMAFVVINNFNTSDNCGFVVCDAAICVNELNIAIRADSNHRMYATLLTCRNESMEAHCTSIACLNG